MLLKLKEEGESWQGLFMFFIPSVKDLSMVGYMSEFQLLLVIFSSL